MRTQLGKAALPVLAALGISLSLASAAGLSAISVSVVQTGDYDADNDGLIEISNLEQLNAVRYDLDGNGEADEVDDVDAYAEAFPGAAKSMGCPGSGCAGYELARNLDFNDPESYGSGSVDKGWGQIEEDQGWPPIGSYGSFNESFRATFDGNDHTILNLFINRQDEDNVGLFAHVVGFGEVNRVGLVDANVTGNSGVGGLVGNNRGLIKGSRATGNVSGWLNIGMLVGSNHSDITDSNASGIVSGDWVVGGLTGGNWGTISGSHSACEVIGRSQVGGLSGGNQGLIEYSHATGDVSGVQTVGGLVGDNNLGGRVFASYATGNVTGPRYRTGGLVGENHDTIMASYATGDVTGTVEVGGLVGANYGERLISSYATGAVSGSRDIGGLVGRNDIRSLIMSSYARGSVSGTGGAAGGADRGKTWNRTGSQPTIGTLKLRGTNLELGPDSVPA